MANIQNNKLELLPHQEEAYTEVEKLFKEKGKAAVVFPTGCGKSFVLLKYILEHPDDRILFLSPRHAIKDQMYEYIVRYIGGDSRPIEEIKQESGSLKQAAKKYIPNIECMLYQTIMGLEEKVSIDEMIGKLKPDIIIVDEMHHLKTKSIREAGNKVLDEDEIEETDEITNQEKLQIAVETYAASNNYASYADIVSVSGSDLESFFSKTSLRNLELVHQDIRPFYKLYMDQSM